MKQWIRQIVLVLLGFFVLATIIGCIYEAIGRRNAAREFPPPGKMVDIGGRRIQLDCRGTGSPTVVFESGHDLNGSLSWSMVQDSIAETTRACTYSRAGIMWSDPVDGQRDGKAIAEDLHAVLKQAGERPPYVLVGHSLGGPYIMTFTKYYGTDVAGLVFVDASHPEQEQRFARITPTEQSSNRLYKLGAALARTGVVRAAIPFFHQGMPRQPTCSVQAMEAYASTSLDAVLRESDSKGQTFTEAGTFRQLGNRPLFVLTGMAPMSADALAVMKWTPEQGRLCKEMWKTLHDDEASWSTSSQHQLVPDSGHYIQFDRPDIVIKAVRSVVNSVRAKSYGHTARK
jgi:pimeloyl-ACP methyl ester carboxylesterase